MPRGRPKKSVDPVVEESDVSVSELEVDEELQEMLSSVENETEEETKDKLVEDVKTKLKTAKKSKKKESKEASVKDIKHALMDALTAELRKKTPGLIIGRATDEHMQRYVVYEHSGWGMPSLDILLNGGPPLGRFITLYGPKSGGKTALAMAFMAKRLTEHEDEYALILDAEHSVDLVWLQKLGVPIDRVIVIPGDMPLEDMGTQGLRTLKYAREQGIKISVCVIDSVGAMSPAVEMEGKKAKKSTSDDVDLRVDHVATAARKINQLLRTWNNEISRSHTATFLIAHIMMDIGGYGGQVMKGGEGLKHFSHVILKVSRKNDSTFEKEVLCPDGQMKKIKVGFFTVIDLEKSKVSGHAGKSVSLPFMIGLGFQTNLAILNSAIGYGIVQKAGAWIKYNDENIGQGIAKAVEYLDQNPLVRAQIEQQLTNAMHGNEETTDE